MKQEITQRQLMEVDKEQSDRLLGWMSNRGYYDTGEVHLTIGIMIDFLNEKTEFRDIRSPQKILNPNCQGWHVYFFWDPQKRKSDSFREQELCDVLWEAVKGVLNEN